MGKHMNIQTANKQKEHAWYTDGIGLLYAAMMVFILVVCFAFPGIAYAKKWETAVSNAVLLPCAAAAFALCVPVLGRMRFKGHTGLVLICLLAGALQIFLVSRYFFYTDWDVETIVDCALAMADGHDISRHSNYFSMYQNNLVLVTLFGAVARLTTLLGLAEHAYFAILVFQCILNWGTGVLLCMLVRRLSSSDFAAASACLFYTLLVGISPWVSIPYSDSVALFFPTAILAVYALMKRTGAAGLFRLFLIAFLSYFGYRIKPQVMILLIAIVMVEGLAAVCGRRLRIGGGTAKGAAACMTGLLCAVLLCNTMAAQVDIEIDRNKSFGLPHFLMMGLNKEEFGAYHQRDVSSSWRAETREARTQMNLSVAAERLAEMGPVGFAQLMIRKTLTNYNDGTFCWGGEGVFYREVLPEADGFFSPLMRNLFYGPKEVYQGEYGQSYGLWRNVVQATWLLVLLLSVAGAVCRRNKAIAVTMLALIGLTIFELLFEARARYLYCYVPLYILLASVGADSARKRIISKRK